jgi:DNA-binding NtrC family response regulator
MHVLLVDDNAACLQAVTLMLKKTGVSITTAKSAHEARALVSTQKFDIIVSDIGLPDAEGFELVEYFCKLKPAVPVVVLSGHVLQSSSEILGKMGVVKILEKPIYTKQIQDIIVEFSP